MQPQQQQRHPLLPAQYPVAAAGLRGPAGGAEAGAWGPAGGPGQQRQPGAGVRWQGNDLVDQQGYANSHAYAGAAAGGRPQLPFPAGPAAFTSSRKHWGVREEVAKHAKSWVGDFGHLGAGEARCVVAGLGLGIHVGGMPMPWVALMLLGVCYVRLHQVARMPVVYLTICVT